MTRADAIDEELEEIQVMKANLEDFVFMEEDAMKYAAKIQKLAVQYPSDRHLAEAAREAAWGFAHFHQGVIDALSRALEALDEAEDSRLNEAEELRNP